MILNVLSRFKDPEEREQQIRNLSSIFDQARRPDSSAGSANRASLPRSTSSAKATRKSSRSTSLTPNHSLSTNSSTLPLSPASPPSRLDIYNTTASIYPNDYRAFNDLGVVQYATGDYDAAKANFAAASRLNPSAAEPQMNLGLIALLNKDYRQANQKLGNAAGLDGSEAHSAHITS